MVVAFEIIIVVVFGIVIAVLVVIIVSCEGLTLNPAVRVIIVVIDEAKGPIITERRIMVVVVKIIINVVSGIVIAVAVAVVIVIVVNCESPALSCLILPAVGIIIVGDEDKGPNIVGARVLDTAVTIIV